MKINRADRFDDYTDGLGIKHTWNYCKCYRFTRVLCRIFRWRVCNSDEICFGIHRLQSIVSYFFAAQKQCQQQARYTGEVERQPRADNETLQIIHLMGDKVHKCWLGYGGDHRCDETWHMPTKRSSLTGGVRAIDSIESVHSFPIGAENKKRKKNN